MKRLGIILCIGSATTLLANQQMDASTPLGIEVGLAYYSHYVYRGRLVSDSALEARISSGMALSNDWSLHGELLYVEGWQDYGFSRTAVRCDLDYYITDALTVAPFVAGQRYHDMMFKSGVEQGIFVQWQPVTEWRVFGETLYDYAQHGVSSQVGVTWQPLLANGLVWHNSASCGVTWHYATPGSSVFVQLQTGVLWGLTDVLHCEPFVEYAWGNRTNHWHKLIVGVRCSYIF